MQDGLLHDKDALIKVAYEAADVNRVLGLLHNAQPELAKRFEGLTHEERMREQEEQRHRAITKYVTGKVLSQLESKGYIEPVEFDERGVRSKYRITHAGSARVKSSVLGDEPDVDVWGEQARELIVDVAQEKPEFTSEDLFLAGLERLQGRSPKGAFSWAESKGYIKSIPRKKHVTLPNGNSTSKRVFISLIVKKDVCKFCGIEVDLNDPSIAYHLSDSWAKREVQPSTGYFRGYMRPVMYEQLGEYACGACYEIEKAAYQRKRSNRTEEGE